jgi:hypothetical protein
VKRKYLFCIIMNLALLVLAACGGGGGEISVPSAKATINLIGILPANTAIAGAIFTMTLPANVTPATTNGVVNVGVASNSGTFAGSSIAPVVIYTAAAGIVPGKLDVILASSTPAGVTQVGEVATITLQLASGAAPSAASFVLSAVGVADLASSQINGMGVNVVNVVLQ